MRVINEVDNVFRPKTSHAIAMEQAEIEMQEYLEKKRLKEEEKKLIC